MKEALTARRVKGPQKRAIQNTNDEETKGAIKVFSLKPSHQVKALNDLSPEQ
jgi:hypothetical protein